MSSLSILTTKQNIRYTDKLNSDFFDYNRRALQMQLMDATVNDWVRGGEINK